MNKLIAIIGMAFVAMPAWAQTAPNAKVSWQYPVTREDNTALALADIRSVLVSAGPCPATGELPTSVVSSLSVNAPATTLTLSLPAWGTWCFTLYVTDMQGRVSTALALRKTLLAPPSPVNNVTVASAVMESFRSSTNAVYLGRNVGQIALGVPCLGDPLLVRDGPDYYAVPRDRVTYTKIPRAAAVLVSRCAVSG